MMNTIVVIANGLHCGYLGCYGNEWVHTPCFDRFASQAVVFDQCFVECPQPAAVHRSWWTGRYARPSAPEFDCLPSDNALGVLRHSGVRTGLVTDHRLLGDAFARAESSTGMLGRWFRKLRGLSPRFGFSDVEWVSGNDSEAEEASSLARVVETGLGWLRRSSGDSPFLLWLECSDPYGPWKPPRKYRELYRDADDEPSRVVSGPISGIVGETVSEEELESLRRTYAAAVTFVDTWLGRFFDQLEAEGYLDKALVVVHSGHGVALGEHDTVGYAPARVLEENTHVPLLVRLPGGQRGGVRSQALVQSPDVAATLWDALGQSAESAIPRFHGGSLLALARGEAAKLRDYAVSWARGATPEGAPFEEWSLRTHGWHLVLPIFEADEAVPRRRQLFVKPEDRWDHNDVADQHAAAADQLELAVRRFEAAVDQGGIDALPRLRAGTLVLEG